MVRRASTGFSLVEMVVVIAVTGLLLALLLPAVQSAREAARRSSCSSHLHQLGLALHQYQEVHSVLPPGSVTKGPAFPRLSGWGWETFLLPYIEQSSLYQQIQFEERTGDHPNSELLRHAVPVSRCPSENAPAVSRVPSLAGAEIELFAGNYVGVEPILTGISSFRLEGVRDGLSSTLLLGESRNSAADGSGRFSTSAWGGVLAFEDGYDYTSVPHLGVDRLTSINTGVHLLGTFSSRHPGGAQFAFGDGHVRMLAESIDLGVYRSLGTPHGGEPVSY